MGSTLGGSCDQYADVVIIGSGAAGMTAAVVAHDAGAEVMVVERAPLFGGTSASSGGVVWIPNNPKMRDLGIDDSREESLSYARAATGGREPDPALLERFVDAGPEMVAYLEAHTPLRFQAPAFCADYFPELPGWKEGGRALESEPFDARQLGDRANRVRVTLTPAPVTLAELGGPGLAGAVPGGGAGSTALLDDEMREIVAERTRTGIRIGGGALGASLFKALLDRGVRMISGSRARTLVTDGNAVTGVRVERDGESFSIGARQAVLLANGGFEWNPELTRAFLPQPLTNPESPPYNEGDALLMAMRAGATITNMTSAWYYPSVPNPTVSYREAYGQLERQAAEETSALSVAGEIGARVRRAGPAPSFNRPSSILVNRLGERFVNEGAQYTDLPRSFFTFDPVSRSYPNEPPVWMVFDAAAVEGADHADWWQSAPSLEALASKIDLPVETFVNTVERWNGHAAAGADPDFGRGSSGFERFRQKLLSGKYGKMMAPLDSPPYFAVSVSLGGFGTIGGPRIDSDARVLGDGRMPIRGLYAAGNAAAGVFGEAYVAAGGTLGPAMVFGYLAGKAMAAEPSRQDGQSDG